MKTKAEKAKVVGVRCESRIVRTFKRAKAECCWPEVESGPLPANLKYPQCEGLVTVVAEVETDPYFGGVDYRLALTATCSHCRHPFLPTFQAKRHEVAMLGKLDVTELFR